MGNILIVEDDRVLNLGLQACLKECGHEVHGVKSGNEALQYIKNQLIDLVILDVNMPGMDGFQVCEHIKKIKEIPVVFLTARDEENDIINGFDLGADDYIIKPFNITVFEKKIDAILKRCNGKNSNLYIYDNFSIDFGKKKALQSGQVINFTPTEYRILELLVMNRGHVVVKESIIQDLWDKSNNWVDEHTLAVNISRIRGKIEEPERRMLRTVFGVGYMWSNNLDEEK